MSEVLQKSDADYCPEVKKSKIEDNIGKTAGNTEQGLGTVVATHYNKLEEKGLDERNKSRIVYLRNFNNWIKSMLISHYLEKLRQDNERKLINVLDMCCGKGGDLLKWKKGDITHAICTDIAKVSVEQCEGRYKSFKERPPYDLPFTAEFIVADCTKIRLKDHFKDKSVKLDIVSCQFSFHYCFESLPQAECMIRNASECLNEGGFFIGTIPDAYDIVARAEKSKSSGFGNDIFKIQFQCDTTKKPLPIFGAKYDFYLEGVVDCPEFLVHFPTFIKLAEKYGLKLVMKKKFPEYFKEKLEGGRGLLGLMQALETYPPFEEVPLQGKPDEYNHAAKYIQESEDVSKVGTLSSMEWEIASLYLVFAFQKVKSETGNKDE